VDTLDVLARRLPAGAVSTDAGLLRDRAIDSWSLALLRRARGDDLAVPAAVVFPARTEEVVTVLAWASEAHVAVIPRGGGSGVCGGAAMPGGAAAQAAAAGSVVLDLSRMNRITAVDPVSASQNGFCASDSIAAYAEPNSVPGSVHVSGAWAPKL